MIYELLSALGIVYIIKYGSIFRGVRQYFNHTVPVIGELLTCSLCLGFYVGLVLTLLGQISHPHALTLFPFASAAWCWSVDILFTVLISLKRE